MKYRQIILEGSRDNALIPYVDLLNSKGLNTNVSQLKQFMLRKLVNEAGMHNLSLDSNFYLVGAVRYYFNGDLTTNKRLNVFYPKYKDSFNPEVCQRLDALIKVLRDAYIDSVGEKWEQPEDFGTLTIQKLMRKYNKKINAELGITPDEQKGEEIVKYDHLAGKKYTYEILYKYEDATKYCKPTHPGSWCITYGQNHFNSYIKCYDIHYVVFRQQGYESIPRRVGPGFTKEKPHDAYGNSLICVLQSNSSPEPVIITSRWNHGSYEDNTQGTEADHAYTKEEFLKVVGCDESVLVQAFNEWKALHKKLGKNNSDKNKYKLETKNVIRAFKYAQMRINNGENPLAVFDGVTPCGLTDDQRDLIKNWQGDERKLYLKLMTFVSLNVNGDTWYTLMNKKKTFPEAILGREIKPRINHISNKCVAFHFYMTRKHMLFDTKKNEFINVDGTIKFQHISFDASYSDKNLPFVCVAKSGNQQALIDLSTMKPIVAKNGSGWFERIKYLNGRPKYSREICLIGPDDYRSSKHIMMLYDSASQEQYIYNLETKQLKDLTPLTKMYKLTNNDPTSNEGVDGYITAKSLSDNTRVFLNADTLQPLVINGESVFRGANMSPNNENYIEVYRLDGTKMFYNQNDRQLIEIEGETKFQNAWLIGDNDSLIKTDPQYRYQQICSISKHKPIPIDGILWFKDTYIYPHQFLAGQDDENMWHILDTETGQIILRDTAPSCRIVKKSNRSQYYIIRLYDSYEGQKKIYVYDIMSHKILNNRPIEELNRFMVDNELKAYIDALNNLQMNEQKNKFKYMLHRIDEARKLFH